MIRQPIFLCLLSVFASLVCIQPHAMSAVVTDQQQTLSTTEVAASPDVVAQSIMPTFDNIVGVRVGVSNSPATSITVGIFDSLSNGTALEAKTVSPGLGTFQEIFFDNPVSVTAGDTYYLVAMSDGGFRGVITDQYDRGNLATVFASINGSGNFVTTGIDNNFPSFDLQFATLSNNSVTAVPEPGTGVLFLGLMAGAVCRRRRSRRSAD